MLIQIATHQPQMLSAIVKHTPIWVWGLLAALLWLGASRPNRWTRANALTPAERLVDLIRQVSA